MSNFYHDGSRELQDRFDTRRLADRIEQRLVGTRIGDEDKAFIESLDMFFLATADEGEFPSDTPLPVCCRRDAPSLNFRTGSIVFGRGLGTSTIGQPS